MLCGVLIITYDHGMLLYAKSFIDNFGLSNQLGGNEYQLSAMLYTLHLTSASIEKVPVDSQIKALSWIQFVCLFICFIIYFVSIFIDTSVSVSCM